MDAKQVVRALKTPVTMLLLLAFVALVAKWAFAAATNPVPPQPPDPCVVTKVGPTLTPDRVYVRVLNGTETNGLAKRVGATLSADGFKVIKRANADTSDKPKTQIVGFSKDSPEVVLVRQAMNNAEIVEDGRVDHTVDVVIGKDFNGLPAHPQLGVPLPNGEACLPQITTVTTTE